jgi:hypothetical protein
MLVEFNPAALRCAGVEPQSFQGQLQQMGFEIEPIPPESATKDIYNNLLCRRSSPGESH